MTQPIKGWHVPTEEYVDAVRGSNGNIGVIADRVGQARATVRERIRDDPDVQAAYMDEYDGMMTLAEDRLFEAIERAEPWAIKLYLTTKGAAKGYGLKMENVGGPVVIINWNELEAPKEPFIVVEGTRDAPALTAADSD
jgi:hypothetical protein